MASPAGEYDAEQLRMMAEECILINEKDQKIGSVDKKTCHQVAEISKGMLHRAFSVFLFDQENRLLLQQRAAAKITYPEVWTNTCCSHPLNRPGEVESSDDLTEKMNGARAAAIRKLDHELGIPTDTLKPEDLKFLTRIHYQSSNDPVWGEHEIDYVFFAQVPAGVDPNAIVTLNENEIASVRWVSLPEFRDLTKGNPGGKGWSPWILKIVEWGLCDKWEAIDDVLQDKIAHDEVIHQI